MFTAALIIIANTWKQPKGSLTDEWIKKLWYIYRIEYYSAMMNEIWPFEATWMDLEMIVLSELSQTKTNIICYYSLVESNFKKMIQVNLFTKQRETYRY